MTRNELTSDAFFRLSDEGKKHYFSTEAQFIYSKAKERFNQQLFDDELLKLLRQTMIFADETSEEWQQAKKLHKAVKQEMAQQTKIEHQAQLEIQLKEKEKTIANMGKYHIGLIKYRAFVGKSNKIKDHAFIHLIDGYNKVIYWHDMSLVRNSSWFADVENESFIEEDNDCDKKRDPIKKIYFNINDKGKGNISKALEILRSDSSWELNNGSGLGVLFRIESSSEGLKATDVITLEEALTEDAFLQFIRNMVKKDINVYFFLMEQMPDQFVNLFSGYACKAAWAYEEHDDNIEIKGVGFDLLSKLNFERREWEKYYPSNIVVFPDSLCEKPVTKIADGAFARIKGIDRVIIPESVLYIGASAFLQSSLKDITLPGKVKTINGLTFARCSRLSEIVIPASVESISDCAFLDCNVKVKQLLS